MKNSMKKIESDKNDKRKKIDNSLLGIWGKRKKELDDNDVKYNKNVELP